MKLHWHKEMTLESMQRNEEYQNDKYIVNKVYCRAIE